MASQSVVYIFILVLEPPNCGQRVEVLPTAPEMNGKNCAAHLHLHLIRGIFSGFVRA